MGKMDTFIKIKLIRSVELLKTHDKIWHIDSSLANLAKVSHTVYVNSYVV